MSLPAGWKRIAVDQVAHDSGRVRILKVTFTASGGGHIYIVSYKDQKETWCRHASTPQDLEGAFEIAHKYLRGKK